MVRVKWARWAVLALVLLAVGGLTWAVLRPGDNGPLKVAERPNLKSAPQASANAERDEFVMIGGVKRRRSDFEPSKSSDVEDALSQKAKGKSDYGKLPPVPADKNIHVKSVVEALRNESSPERLSVLARPRKFDVKAFKANSKAYLDVVEPSRVFQSAQPGPGVATLRSLTPGVQQVAQGDSVVLRVAAPSGAPVTFTSFDAGEFENQLTSITVQANKSGTAEARFLATPGTVHNVHILAGSPLASGQAKFLVNVSLPDAIGPVAPNAAGL